MLGKIPQNVLDDILGRIDIVELIASFVPLKRAGRNFKACCPFHHEKTPSFLVSSDKQIYHCFGCGESGNAFKFLMRFEKMDFPDAVETLAKKTGVILPQKTLTDKNESLNIQLFKINDSACEYYQQNLFSENGQSAVNYFLKRSIKKETAKLFRLGLALDKWDGLINVLRAKQINLMLLEKAGLICPKDNGGFYDRFRSRIVFPIFDVKSRVIAFGGRIFEENQNSDSAKYMNSPETPIYIKGRHLYGLHLAKDSIRDKDQAVIVEGYLDFMIPYQEGVKNIVASLGTALTKEQASLLKRYSRNVVMIYDGDDAGQLATLRNLDILIEEQMSVKVVALPKGQDPDSFVRTEGVDKFQELIDTAEDLFDYKLRFLKSQFDWRKIEGKAKISQEMLFTINKFQNAVMRSEYIKKLAETLNVKEEALLLDAKQFKDSLTSRGEQIVPVAQKQFNITPTEKLLIKLMLEENAFISRIRNELTPEDFQDEKISEMVHTMFDLVSEGKDVSANKLVNYVSDERTADFICKSIFESEIADEDKERIVDDCVKLIKQRKQVSLKQELQKKIKEAEELNDEESLLLLKEEFCKLIKKGR